MRSTNISLNKFVDDAFDCPLVSDLPLILCLDAIDTKPGLTVLTKNEDNQLLLQKREVQKPVVWCLLRSPEKLFKIVQKLHFTYFRLVLFGAKLAGQDLGDP